MARRLIGTRRRAAWALLALAVLVLHGAVTRWLADTIAGWGKAASPPPERLSAVFVREVTPAAPVALPAPPPVAPRKKPRAKRPPQPAPAASQPQAAASQPQAAQAAASQPQMAEAAASQPQLAEAPAPSAEAESAVIAAAAAAALRDSEAEPAPPPASAPDSALASATGAAAPAPANAASAPPAVEWPSQWPASTRLSYSLTGWYRGELHGSASVEWLRAGTHYQVHLEVAVGPSFAPFIARRMSSDGELTADGLAPRRYDEETRVGLSSPRLATILFEPDAVVLPNGRRRERWPGVQDAASQFVHLSWLFTTQPHLLTAGNTIEIPLALPRSVDHWAYDVLAADELQAPFGRLPVLHLKPRRVTRPGGDFVFEAWFAPTLLYLPVRIRIHQDQQNFADLMIDRPPLQGER